MPTTRIPSKGCGHASSKMKSLLEEILHHESIFISGDLGIGQATGGSCSLTEGLLGSEHYKIPAPTSNSNNITVQFPRRIKTCDEKPLLFHLHLRLSRIHFITYCTFSLWQEDTEFSYVFRPINEWWCFYRCILIPHICNLLLHYFSYLRAAVIPLGAHLLQEWAVLQKYRHFVSLCRKKSIVVYL